MGFIVVGILDSRFLKTVIRGAETIVVSAEPIVGSTLETRWIEILRHITQRSLSHISVPHWRLRIDLCEAGDDPNLVKFGCETGRLANSCSVSSRSGTRSLIRTIIRSNLPRTTSGNGTSNSFSGELHLRHDAWRDMNDQL